MDVRTVSIYEAGYAKIVESQNSVSKNINSGVKNYCHNEICLNTRNQWKHSESILKNIYSYFDSFKKLIMGKVENMPVFSKVTSKEYNVRSEHATVDKLVEEHKRKRLDGDFKQSEEGYIFSVGGSTDDYLDGCKPKDISKIQPNDQNKKAVETKKVLSVAEVKEALQKRQLENIVDNLRKSRPQQGDQRKQLTKEQIQQLNYALLCRVYELNRPGTVPPHMQDEQPLPRPTAKKPKAYGPPKRIKKPSRKSSYPKPRRDDVECNN